MPNVPLDTRFVGISPSVNLTERKSASVNAETQPYSMQDIADTVGGGGGGGGYLKYVAFLSQLSTNTPVATVLENTLGGNVTFTYVSIGTYQVNLPITGNVWISMTNNSSGSNAILEYETPTNQPINYFRIRTNEFLKGSPADINLNDSCLYGMSLEIRVYP